MCAWFMILSALCSKAKRYKLYPSLPRAFYYGQALLITLRAAESTSSCLNI